MDCDLAIELVVDSLLHGITDEVERELDDHLARCASCAWEARHIRQLWIEMSRPAREPTAAKRFREKRIWGPQGPTPRRRWSPAAALLALIFVLAVGMVAGRASVVTPKEPPEPMPPHRLFLILARGGSSDSHAHGYREWVNELHRQGTLLLAERLAEGTGLRIRNEGLPAAKDTTTSVYLIRALDYPDVERIVRSCPDYDSGATIEAHPLSPPHGVID